MFSNLRVFTAESCFACILNAAFFIIEKNVFIFINRGEFNSPTSNFGNVHPSDVLDMPVDPNEPTYCLCHQVSYGEMIGCDNTDVSFLAMFCLRSNKGLLVGNCEFNKSYH